MPEISPLTSVRSVLPQSKPLPLSSDPLSKKAQAKYFPLVPDILNILPPIKESGDSDELSRALIALIDLAEVAPKMFKPLFHSLVTFSISVVQDKELEEQARQNALELMATFADVHPGMCRKDQSYTTEMVTQCLSLMTEVGVDDEDCEEWSALEDVGDSHHVVSSLPKLTGSAG